LILEVNELPWSAGIKVLDIVSIVL
jgi:hypothetical protein